MRWTATHEPERRDTYTEFHDLWGFDADHVYAVAWGDVLRFDKE